MVGLVAGTNLSGQPTESPTGESGLVVHEWGTFTSFAGPNGELRRFNIRIGDDLPAFVRAKLPGSAQWGSANDGDFEKAQTLAMQRMETPVIYFYNKPGDKPIEVDVEVRMPKGVVTEAFPPVSFASPGTMGGKFQTTVPEGGSIVRWQKVRTQAKYCCDFLGMLDAGTSHYAAARATDSDLLLFPFEGQERQEKFLFYRGIAEGDLGLKARAAGKDRFILDRSDKGEPSSVFAVEVSGRTVRFAQVNGVKAGQQISLPQDSSTTAAALGEAVASALEHAGLYRREAVAMVDTWKHLWFGESGARLLVILPQAAIDENLPLTISPSPRELKRVFVARLEMLTPEKSAWIEGLIERLDRASDDAEREVLNRQLASLGRFRGPAVQYAREVLRARPKATSAAELPDGGTLKDTAVGCR